MPNTPHISVVVPTYNRCTFIEKAIDSIISQDFTNWECIVVDDGSTDNTKERVKTLYKTSDKIRYYYKANGGAGSARNFGMRNARGKYICFLDSDDVYEKETLTLFAGAFEKYPEGVFAFGHHINTKNFEHPPNVRLYEPIDIYPFLVYGNFLSSVVCIKNIVNDKIRYDEQLPTAEDYQFALDISRENIGIYINKHLFKYNIGNHSKSSQYIDNGGYIEAIIDIVERELSEVSKSTRGDKHFIEDLWKKRLNILKFFSETYYPRLPYEISRISQFEANQYNLWHDATYVLYRISDVVRRINIAINLLNTLDKIHINKGRAISPDLIASITDAAYCAIRNLPFHKRVIRSLQFLFLAPNKYSLKQTLKAILQTE